MLISREKEARVDLTSATALPRASAFLWNKHMMVQVNCRGYVSSQFMQPEPAKYSYAPNLEAKTFMHPEQPYYANHPGRFLYIKDNDTNELFSVPYEPVRSKLDSFVFSTDKHQVTWTIQHLNIQVSMQLSLTTDRVLELWSVSIVNLGQKNRNLSIYPYFTIGYMSWMNQGADYNSNLQGIICSCISPYQKYQDYDKVKEYKDKTFFLADCKPDAWETQQEVFEGEGGLKAPDAITQRDSLLNNNARYETPACIMQYKITLSANEQRNYRFLFGAAKDEDEIQQAKELFLSKTGFDNAARDYQDYIAQGQGCLTIDTPDENLNHFVNHWLARQVFYHGDVNRLTTDPQTRNYLQDNMGMAYIKPEVSRHAFLHALAQQKSDGSMPDGILLRDDAELKYINRVPHTDHCVWLPVCLKAYLDETDDFDILTESIPYSDSDEKESVYSHLSKAVLWLYNDRDERGLSYIAQGDWCDPMNMVGYKGKGVSGWLTLATAYALKEWAAICRDFKSFDALDAASNFEQYANECNEAANKHFWHDQWYGRGITDDDVLFGISSDPEGKIFLNPQSWAMLSGASDAERNNILMKAIEEQLETPYGVSMLAPAYTSMREDIGRVTQKFPGSAENGSIYNHASTFYIYALYKIGQADKAFELLSNMLTGPNEQDLLQRGQLPIFIPNYYRGAYYQIPDRAGRSSQLFNTGTVHWYYRCLVDGLFGVQGSRKGLHFNPQLPKQWNHASLTRKYKDAVFEIKIQRKPTSKTIVYVNGEKLDGLTFNSIEPGSHYKVMVAIPETNNA